MLGAVAAIPGSLPARAVEDPPWEEIAGFIPPPPIERPAPSPPEPPSSWRRRLAERYLAWDRPVTLGTRLDLRL